jgi:hypothetical protein
MAFGRLESLLSAFPRLLETGQQHTFIEKDSLRYLYQAIEENYVVVLTNRLSNVLSDLRSVSVFASITTSTLRLKGTDKFTEDICFTLLLAFDEVCSDLGLSASNPEILRDVLTMKSNEEDIQEAIIQVEIYHNLCRQRLRRQKKLQNKKLSSWKCRKRRHFVPHDSALIPHLQLNHGQLPQFRPLTYKKKPDLSIAPLIYPPS